MRPLCIVLAGLPASGKSTFAARLEPCLSGELDGKTMIVSSDTVRSEIPSLQRAFVPELEPAVRAMTLDRVESGLMRGLSVIHDDLNYYRSMRYDLVAMAKRLEVPHFLIHLAATEEVCLERNRSRGSKVPDSVILKDAARFDPPGLDPWDMPVAAVDGKGLTDEGIQALAMKLLSLAKAYQPFRPPVRLDHTPTRAEELDLLARRVVSDLYQEDRIKSDGKTVSTRRRLLVSKAEKEGLSDLDAESLFRAELVLD